MYNDITQDTIVVTPAVYGTCIQIAVLSLLPSQVQSNVLFSAEKDDDKDNSTSDPCFPANTHVVHTASFRCVNSDNQARVCTRCLV